MKLPAICLACGLWAVFATGCLSSPGGLAPSTLPITGKDSYVVVQRNAHGGNSTIGLFAIPLWPTNAYDSLQETKAKYQADGLINVSVENRTWWPVLIPIVTYHQLVVKGDAIKFKQGERTVRQ